MGELGQLKSHLDSDKGCGYVEVTCTNKQCRNKMKRKDLQSHLQEKCHYRPYECEHCGHKDTYTAITGERANPLKSYGNHYSKCPEYLLDCPNQCGVTGIKRTAMPDHHSFCPLELLDCPFNDAGCTEKIARKDMEDHMIANQQKHILQGYQSLQQMKKELDDTKKELQETKQELHTTKQDFSNELQIITVGLRKIGDTLTFRVTDFPQMRMKKKVWYSNPFSIANKVKVQLAVYPSGLGRGQHSHVSVSLILIEVVRREEDTRRRLPHEEIRKNTEHKILQYNVSVTAIGQHMNSPVIHTVLALCTSRQGDISKLMLSPCSARFPFPSPGGMLRSDELFLKIEDANSLLLNDSMILELRLLEHQHH